MGNNINRNNNSRPLKKSDDYRELELDILASIAFSGFDNQDNNMQDKITELSEDDFYDLNAKKIFSNFYNQFQSNGYIDPAKLKGAQYILISNRQYTTLSYLLSGRIEKLKEISSRRSILRASYKAEDMLEEGKDLEEVRSWQIGELSKIDKKKDLTLSEIDKNFEDVLTEGKTLSVDSGFRKLDWLTGGFLEGSLNIIAAPQGQGKTTLAMAMMLNMLKNSKKALFVTLEMTTQALYSKIISYLTGISFIEILRGKKKMGSYWQKFDETDWLVINQAREEMSSYNLEIFGDRDLMTYDIKSKIHKIGGCDIVYVDYLQRLKPQKDARTIYERTSNIVKELKSIALECNIPFVVISSINRDYSDRKDFKPHISDLRNSGELEYEADMVLLLHRESAFRDPKEWEDPEDFERKAELIIAKNRYGESNLTIELYTDLAKSLIREKE